MRSSYIPFSKDASLLNSSTFCCGSFSEQAAHTAFLDSLTASSLSRSSKSLVPWSLPLSLFSSLSSAVNSCDRFLDSWRRVSPSSLCFSHPLPVPITLWLTAFLLAASSPCRRLHVVTAPIHWHPSPTSLDCSKDAVFAGNEENSITVYPNITHSTGRMLFSSCSWQVPGLLWVETLTGESCFNRRKRRSAAFSSQILWIAAEELNNTFPGIWCTWNSMKKTKAGGRNSDLLSDLKFKE